MFCQEQELDSDNVVSSPPVHPPGTLFLLNFTTLPTPVHSENDLRVYLLIVLFQQSTGVSLEISAGYRLDNDNLIVAYILALLTKFIHCAVLECALWCADEIIEMPHSLLPQGSHSPGKPGKLLEFYVRP